MNTEDRIAETISQANRTKTYPCIIQQSRYSGVYEGGLWSAFLGYEAPAEASGDDITCMEWWDSPTCLVGVGDTPNSAWLDLVDKVDTCEHPKKRILSWTDINNLSPVQCIWCGQIIDRVVKLEFDNG